MIHLMFLNRRFDIGGAERQLIELLKRIDKSRFRVSVITFYHQGTLQSETETIEGINLVNLGKGGRYDVIPFLWRLWQAVRVSRPHIIHGYLDLANVLALFVGRLTSVQVVWGIRASNMNPAQYGWTFRLSLHLQNMLGRFADLIIVNSYAGRNYFLSRGFPQDKMIVIPNGIDAQRFHPDLDARCRIRIGWDIKDDETLIGLVGRLDPAKDHLTFIRSAALLAQHIMNARFVCVGDGPKSYHEDLQKLVQEMEMEEKLLWAGSRNDMPDVYNALDILTSSSLSEGFPNVVGEAMACGVPCVVTDVGDSAWLVGDTGIVVPPSDPQALASAWKEMLGMLDVQPSLGASARSRIITEFSADKLAERTAEVLAALVRN